MGVQNGKSFAEVRGKIYLVTHYLSLFALDTTMNYTKNIVCRRCSIR